VHTHVLEELVATSSGLKSVSTYMMSEIRRPKPHMHEVISSGIHCNQCEAASEESMFHTGFLLGLLFSPESGGDMFLQNISWHSMDYMAF
jgi:hypothetical protein